jgi:hypothetical protein
MRTAHFLWPARVLLLLSFSFYFHSPSSSWGSTNRRRRSLKSSTSHSLLLPNPVLSPIPPSLTATLTFPKPRRRKSPIDLSRVHDHTILGSTSTVATWTKLKPPQHRYKLAPAAIRNPSPRTPSFQPYRVTSRETQKPSHCNVVIVCSSISLSTAPFSN